MQVSSSKSIREPDIPAKTWKGQSTPRRILAIRLQALGDVVITFPYLQYLRDNLPEGTRIDFLTREEVNEIPENLQLFDKVYSIGGGRNVRKQFMYTSLLLPKLWLKRYEVVIDLQNNIVSHFVRKALMPRAWSVFDRFSPIAAGESTRLTIQAAGLKPCYANNSFKLKGYFNELELLKENGWDGKSQLVIINPAGAFPSRNWPLDSYVGFMKHWLNEFPETKFLALGVGAIMDKIAHFEKIFPDKFINLINKTSSVQAFAIIQHIQFILSEDSGLMHMAWVSGIPTLALFGSTRSDRARPLGDHSYILHSGDLTCGNCMDINCQFGDTHCLLRYTAEFVFETARRLLKREPVVREHVRNEPVQGQGIV